MGKSQLLLLATAALSLYAVGNVWPVQLSAYPLWRCVGRREFHRYHDVWWHSIWGVIIGPAVLLFCASILMLWWRPEGVPGWSVWAGFGLELALVLGTAVWWGPLMARLEDDIGGLAADRYRLLLRTHWARVAIVSGHGALMLWMLAKALIRPLCH